MIYNQYAYVETAPAKQVEELLSINFLPANYQDLSFSNLLAVLTGNVLAEATTRQAKEAKFIEYAVSPSETLAQFLAKQPAAMTAAEFYDVALQLLGYHPGYDYSLTDPMAVVKKQALPSCKDLENKDDLISAFYRLLNTRAKNGQTLLDVMAGKGYFTQFWGEGQFKFFNGKSLPVFDTSKVIREVVYVESDLDTDEDGQNDLLPVTVFRPAESQDQLKVPALYTASPYFGGIIDNAAQNHSVDENLTDATTWTNPKYVAKPMKPAPKPTDEDVPATEVALGKSSYALNEYLLARGFASVFSGAIGNRHGDGLRITGAPEETISQKEVIEWLTGDRVAYTDRTRRFETKASWCTGNIGMTGRSYLGTLQIAIATTGVKGLKTVVSEAAISSWYDYYREHGLVVAPGECQGEDLDKLAEVCQSNLWDGGNFTAKVAYEKEQKYLEEAQDRATGQYSDFWEARNYRHHADGIKCSWISVHGLNDWNVKPKNVYKIWQKVKELPVESHLFLHQGPHYNMNNLVSIDFTDLMNLWFVHELLGIENNARKQWPKVLIQDNLEADKWHEEKDWANMGQETVYGLTDDHELSTLSHGSKQETFTDLGGKEFKEAGISETAWEYQFISGEEKWAKASLRFTSDEFAHPVTIVGRPKVHIKVAASKPVGQLSVALVELGERKRLTPTPKVLERSCQEFGFRFGAGPLQEFVPDKATKAKLITKAHMNLQNYQDMHRPSKLEAGQFVDLVFELQPTYYTMPAGSKLVLIIYSTDQGMTKRPLVAEDYTIDLADSELLFYKK